MTNFEKLKHMSDNDMDINLVPISNIIEIDVKGQNAYVKIGMPASMGRRLMSGDRFVGGLILANAEEYESIDEPDIDEDAAWLDGQISAHERRISG